MNMIKTTGVNLWVTQFFKRKKKMKSILLFGFKDSPVIMRNNIIIFTIVLLGKFFIICGWSK